MPFTPTTTPAIVTTEPLHEGPSTFIEVGGSSVPPGFSPPRTDLDASSVRLAQHLAKQQVVAPSSKGKGIAFSEGYPREDVFVIDEL